MLDTLMKHAKFFTEECAELETKAVVHFHDCGSFFMANGIVAVFALNVHNLGDCTKTPSGKDSTIKPITLDKIINIIGAAEKTSLINANVVVEELLHFTQGVISFSYFDSESEEKGDPLFNINLKAGEGLVYEQHGVELSSSYKEDEVKTEEDVIGATVNAKHLEKVLKVFSDLGYDDVNLLITGRFRPVEIRSYDCKIRTVVMPVRTY